MNGTIIVKGIQKMLVNSLGDGIIKSFPLAGGDILIAVAVHNGEGIVNGGDQRKAPNISLIC